MGVEGHLGQAMALKGRLLVVVGHLLVLPQRKRQRLLGATPQHRGRGCLLPQRLGLRHSLVQLHPPPLRQAPLLRSLRLPISVLC